MERKFTFKISVIIILMVLSCSGFLLLKKQVYRLKKEIEVLNLKILSEYDTLAGITSNITLEILNLSQPESVKAIIQSLFRPLGKYDVQFSKAIKSGDYDLAIYLMNKRVGKFFEIINYGWEYVPSFKSDTSFLSRLSQISPLEEKIDSLMTVARKKKEKLYILSKLTFSN